MYEIHSPLESVLGGPIRLHLIGDGWNWQHCVSGHAVWARREDAQAFADALPECQDWRGDPVGRPVVVEI